MVNIRVLDCKKCRYQSDKKINCILLGKKIVDITHNECLQAKEKDYIRVCHVDRRMRQFAQDIGQNIDDWEDPEIAIKEW